jgi:hypothetical protein
MGGSVKIISERRKEVLKGETDLWAVVQPFC